MYHPIQGGIGFRVYQMVGLGQDFFVFFWCRQDCHLIKSAVCGLRLDFVSWGDFELSFVLLLRLRRRKKRIVKREDTKREKRALIRRQGRDHSRWTEEARRTSAAVEADVGNYLRLTSRTCLGLRSLTYSIPLDPGSSRFLFRGFDHS